jgi:large subunit ribosomal protein L9
MQVILTADVPHLGNMGDVVQVADGYGRNFLIPQRLAVQATTGARAHFRHVKRQVDTRSAKLREAAMGQHKQLDGVSVTLAKRTAASDKLYGSVTNREIADALAEVGHPIDKRHIQLEEHIRELGIYAVPIKLHADVIAKVRVWVVKM